MIDLVSTKSTKFVSYDTKNQEVDNQTVMKKTHMLLHTDYILREKKTFFFTN